MRGRAGLVLIAAAGVLCLGMSQCPRSENDLRAVQVPELTKNAFDPRSGAGFMVPGDWTVTVKEKNPVVFAAAPEAGPNGPLANLVVERISQRMDPYDYLRANVISMKISLQNLEFIRGGVEMSGEESTAWMTYSFLRGKAEVKALSYCRTRDYRAYVVTAIAPADRFPEYEALFRAMGRSLWIMEKAGPG